MWRWIAQLRVKGSWDHLMHLPQFAHMGLWPRRLSVLPENSQFSAAELAGGSQSPAFLPSSFCFPQAIVDPKAGTEALVHTSDHSPVIQTYSQGCKLQLSRSAGRLLMSQCPAWTSPLLFSSKHTTLRYLEPSPQVLVHCERQTKQVMMWKNSRIIVSYYYIYIYIIYIEE